MIKICVIAVICILLIVYSIASKGKNSRIKLGITLAVITSLLGYYYFSEIRAKDITEKGVNKIEVSSKTYKNDCYSCKVGSEEEKYNGKEKVTVADCDLELLERISTSEGKGNKLRKNGREFKLYNIDIDKAREYEKNGFKTDTYELSIKLYLKYANKKVLAGEIKCYRLSKMNGVAFDEREMDTIKSQVSKVFDDKSLSGYKLFGDFAKAGTDKFSVNGGIYPESGFLTIDYSTQEEECNKLWGTEKDFLNWCRQFNSVTFYQGQSYSESRATIILIIYIGIVAVLFYIEMRFSLLKSSV